MYIRISVTLMLCTILVAPLTAAQKTAAPKQQSEEDSKRASAAASVTAAILAPSASSTSSSAACASSASSTSKAVASAESVVAPIALSTSAKSERHVASPSLPTPTSIAPSSPALTSTIASSKDSGVAESSLTPIDPIHTRSAFASLLSLGQGIFPAAFVNSVLSGASDEEQLRQFAVYGKLEALDKESLVKHFNGALARLARKAKDELRNYAPLRVAQIIKLGRERQAVCEVQTVLELEAQLKRYLQACTAAFEQISLLKQDMVEQLQTTQEKLTDKS